MMLPDTLCVDSEISASGVLRLRQAISNDAPCGAFLFSAYKSAHKISAACTHFFSNYVETSPLFDLLRFVAVVISVDLPFLFQPAPTTLTLALRGRAVGLVGDFWVWVKIVATGFALLGHDVLHTSIEMERA